MNELIVGYAALRDSLRELGILASVSSLETRRRRYALPHHGRGPQGREICFTQADVDSWILHFTGLTRSQAQTALINATKPLAIRRPRTSTLQPELLLPTVLYVATETRVSLGEDVFRDDRGVVSAGFETIGLQYLYYHEWQQIRCWRYMRGRRAKPADLVLPKRRRLDSVPGTLVGWFVLDERDLRWVRVPGKLFGLAGDVNTLALASKRFDRFGELNQWITLRHPDAFALVWSHRRELMPIIWEDPLPEIDMAGLIADLCARHPAVRRSEDD